ncbi:molybdenum cofactor guanylyltransferase [Actinocrinis puniceicyclus]|uniref:Molybdenum cofactor guanylyltransferase n=1 Tax=Actinocrinis puniceicyclus TaxID=977794 RepID=A0A8J7WNY5_9ACTN|nr:molybdenum cofactor guanylyltransferase [Actinocrinis puniceicyclus]MBS2963284.1 molybdenum cofactor guanylyltransferase [Actinocrinis puniceicyclus]
MDVLILAGGASRRLRGADKPMVEIGGRTLLDRVIDACAEEAEPGGGSVVVVGPPRPTARPVRWVREEPPGGGPVAAIAAGLTAGADPWVGVFAADLPFLTRETVHSLWMAAARARSACDGAVAVDAAGREQWLAAVYRREALASRLGPIGANAGFALRRVVHDLALVRLAQPGDAVLDCDTWEDVVTARRIADRGRAPQTRPSTP